MKSKFLYNKYKLILHCVMIYAYYVFCMAFFFPALKENAHNFQHKQYKKILVRAILPNNCGNVTYLNIITFCKRFYYF